MENQYQHTSADAYGHENQLDDTKLPTHDATAQDGVQGGGGDTNPPGVDTPAGDMKCWLYHAYSADIGLQELQQILLSHTNHTHQWS